MRKFIFKDKNKEVLLPVTPPSFAIDYGINIETVNIHTIGDVNIVGEKRLGMITLDCMLPAKDYPFSFAREEPYEYVDQFKKWIDDKEIIRFIITGTPNNIPVIIESISISEKDGTNDVYATIILREYKELGVVKIESAATKNTSRSVETPPVKTRTHKIVRGDTLSAICRKYYGNANLYPKLATVNNIKNPNLIYTGDILKIPEKL